MAHPETSLKQVFWVKIPLIIHNMSKLSKTNFFCYSTVCTIIYTIFISIQQIFRVEHALQVHSLE